MRSSGDMEPHLDSGSTNPVRQRMAASECAGAWAAGDELIVTQTDQVSLVTKPSIPAELFIPSSADLRAGDRQAINRGRGTAEFLCEAATPVFTMWRTKLSGMSNHPASK